MDTEASVSRTVLLIRHGQYQQAPEKLTEQGCRQARLVAKAVGPYKATRIYSSTMPRAKETAAIIAAELGMTVSSKAFFREGSLPGTTRFVKSLGSHLPADKKLDHKNKLELHQRRVRQAFEFLKRPVIEPSSCEIVVAHGNVIRHWVCMVLQIDPSEKWMLLDVPHASVTKLSIFRDGRVILRGFSDCGHIPHELRSYT